MPPIPISNFNSIFEHFIIFPWFSMHPVDLRSIRAWFAVSGCEWADRTQTRGRPIEMKKFDYDSLYYDEVQRNIRSNQWSVRVDQPSTAVKCYSKNPPDSINVCDRPCSAFNFEFSSWLIFETSNFVALIFLLLTEFFSEVFPKIPNFLLASQWIFLFKTSTFWRYIRDISDFSLEN